MSTLENSPSPYGYLALFSITGFILGLFFPHFIEGDTPLEKFLIRVLPFQLFASIGFILALCYLKFRFRGKCSLGKILDLRPGWPNWMNLGKNTLILIPSVWLLNFISGYLCRLLHIPIVKQALEANAGDSPSLLFWIVSGISAVILSPITEELIFRLAIFESLLSIFPSWAMPLTALIFSLLHGMPQFFAGLFLFGLILQKSRLTGGVKESILLHSIWNLLAFLQLLIMTTLAK